MTQTHSPKHYTNFKIFQHRTRTSSETKIEQIRIWALTATLWFQWQKLKFAHQFYSTPRPYYTLLVNATGFRKRVSHQIGTNQKQELSRQFSVNGHSDTVTWLPMRAPQPPKQSLTSKSFLANPEGKIDKKLETFSLSISRPQDLFSFNKEYLAAFPQSHRRIQVTRSMKKFKTWHECFRGSSLWSELSLLYSNVGVNERSHSPHRQPTFLCFLKSLIKFLFTFT